MLAWLRRLVSATDGSLLRSPVVTGSVSNTTPGLNAASREALREALARINADAAAAASRQAYGPGFRSLSNSTLDAIVEQTAGLRRGPARHRLAWAAADASMGLLEGFVRRDDVTLPHVLRLLVSIGALSAEPRFMWSNQLSRRLVNELGRIGRASLVELHAACEALRLPTDPIMANWFSRIERPIADGWPDQAIWPYFEQHPEMLEQAFASSSANPLPYWMRRERMFDALVAFPEPPERFVPRLFEMALGSAKLDRAAAQRALERLPDKEARIITALSSREADARASAASWLARLKYADAIPQLQAALGRERNDAVAGALMSALESLGAPVDHFLNRAKLAGDAERGLAKGAPPDLAWFPFDRQPAVHWSDTGDRIEPSIIGWFLIQSSKLKSPEPNGILRRYCAQMRAAEREALAAFVLSAWLEQDVKRTANGLAGSAIASKGILAIAAACGGGEVVAAAHRYIKEFYGNRAAQCKALIQMLGWLEHPAASQLLISIGERFRTRGIQEEAARQVELLAERRGWTETELADRSIPTAGFDENGELLIDYGERRFTARLTADLAIRLHTADGKSITNLPEPRDAEDAARVSEAKKLLAMARRELKTTISLQKQRLYEAMCSERRWRYEDLKVHLLHHPIIHRHCQRLVWGVERPGAAVTFRPRGGVLRDVTDQEIVVTPDDRIFLAHDITTPDDVAAAWREHFARLELEPLFQQFGRSRYVLAAAMKDASAIADFRGHRVQALALRRRADKLGYTRGAIEEGGFFYRYHKHFPSLGLTATLEMSGSTFPETDLTVALRDMSFERHAAEPDEDIGALALADVPAVLLCECWNDLRLMATDGTGFAANWRQTSPL